MSCYSCYHLSDLVDMKQAKLEEAEQINQEVTNQRNALLREVEELRRFKKAVRSINPRVCNEAWTEACNGDPSEQASD